MTELIKYGCIGLFSILGLYLFWRIAKAAGRQEVKTETNEKRLENVKKNQEIDNMSHNALVAELRKRTGNE